jgi:hypothetical protein
MISISFLFWFLLSILFLSLAVIASLERRELDKQLKPFEGSQGGVKMGGSDGLVFYAKKGGKEHTLVVHRFFYRMFTRIFWIEALGFIGALLAALFEIFALWLNC